jgi:outer membrane protein assembly factor BamB
MRWIIAFLLLVAATAHAQEWNRFRGPNGAGVSPDKFPIQWTEKDYLWSIALPGRGHSSPVAWQDHFYVTSAEDKTGKRFVTCVNAKTGTTIWQREFEDKGYAMHKRNSIATSTPTVDNERLYLTWSTPANYVVQALDRKTGKDVWTKSLGKYVSQHGFGASPIVYENLLILTNEQDKKGSLHALDAKTGAEVWKIARNSGNATYSAPCIYQPPGRAAEIIFTNWQHGITAVEPSTGKIKWEISCFEPKKAERAIVSPIIAGDLVIGTCGFVTAQKHFVAVRPTNDGGVKEVWRIEKAVAYLPTPVVKGDRIFACSELGVMSCIEAATGKVIWQERLDNQFSSSPVCAGNVIYCTANDGEVFVIDASDTFKLLGRSLLPAGTQSTPAITAGVMVFRAEGRLVALPQRAESR